MYYSYKYRLKVIPYLEDSGICVKITCKYLLINNVC